MKVSLIILALMFLTQDGQVTLGTGIVKIAFNEKTVIDFYEKPTDKDYFKRIEFFDDKETNSWSIKNLEAERAWLKPEMIWLDYSQFNFRCKSTTTDWLQLVVNNESGLTLWIKRTKTTSYLTWEDYLKNASLVERLNESKQKIRRIPDNSGEEIRYEGQDCFQVKSLKGDWIEIFTPDHCDEVDPKNKVKSGWIKWRDRNKLIIDYYTSC